MKPISVIVVDDSALMRSLMTELLEADPQFEVVATARDPYDAWEKVKRLSPELMTLDVEMPRMDGLSFLERLMHMHPMPVVMVSSLTENGCDTTLRALELGAVDFVTKPKFGVEAGVRNLAGELLDKLRSAAHAKPRVRKAHREATSITPKQSLRVGMLRTTTRVVALGASTGGTEAIRDVLTQLPADSPPIAIVQHMPAGYTAAFATRLNTLCAVAVKEAADGDRLMQGRVLIAPGDRHMSLVRSGADYCVRVYDGERVNRHRPSVDVLFDSFARLAGANAVGVILTGMGADGADGMVAMRHAGARTIAEDESTCVVYGMPREAALRGGAEQVLPLPDISRAILRACGS
jgi:two-component system, chemotaxis family, protein-glutamate methylesterase/glutaminase